MKDLAFLALIGATAIFFYQQGFRAGSAEGRRSRRFFWPGKPSFFDEQAERRDAPARGLFGRN